MTQTLPLTIVLGSAYTGLAIGYRVLNLDRTVYSAFTTTAVAETDVVGTYAVSGGVVAPNAGGYVIAGTALLDYAETVIEPAESAGVYSKVYTVQVGGVPKAGVYCWLATQAAPTVAISAGTSDSLGQVTFWHSLPTGTAVYVTAALDGYNTLVDSEVI
jgi:hypothetical protein